MAKRTKCNSRGLAMNSERLIAIEGRFKAVIHEWDQEMVDCYDADSCEGPFNPEWLDVWVRMRQNLDLMGRFAHWSVLDELNATRDWPPLSHEGISSLEQRPPILSLLDSITSPSTRFSTRCLTP